MISAEASCVRAGDGWKVEPEITEFDIRGGCFDAFRESVIPPMCKRRLFWVAT